MRVGLVTNLAGKGLEVDACLLQEYLVSLGHEATLIQFDQPHADKYDLGIFLEVVPAHLFGIAPRLFYFANPEWLKPEYTRPIQRAFAQVFAKTHDAERVLREHFHNVVYTGFLSRDARDQSVKRELKFLHVGGDSGYKNTNAVIAAWREYRWWNGESALSAPLTIVSKSIYTSLNNDVSIPGVTFIKQVDEPTLRRLQNSHFYHVLPSAYEGFGHAIHESMSCGALVLSTDAEPMNELKSPFHVPACGTRKNNLATLHEVSGAAIREAVPRMLEQPSHVIARMQVEARLKWEKGNEEFQRLFTPFLNSSVRASGRSQTAIKLAVWGNLRPEHSTENDWVRSFEALGCQVLTFQEDECPTEEILKECVGSGVQLLAYVHTHSWKSPGKMSEEELVQALRKAGIKTVSPHLDLYFGLNIADGRDSKVGKHPFFHTDYVMTADGSSQEKFLERGVNHVWMKPGVLASACIPGKFRKDLAVDIGFCGAESYHPEWEWRGKMIQTLREVYGNRFRVLTGFRGQRLNDLYASVKILVGDCCFAGKPKYYSDRWPETCGRGGFLLAPQIEGCCIPTATFAPCDTLDLLDKIDYYLEHDEERDLIRIAAHEHVKAHDTYTHRAQQILKVCGL